MITAERAREIGTSIKLSPNERYDRAWNHLQKEAEQAVMDAVHNGCTNCRIHLPNNCNAEMLRYIRNELSRLGYRTYFDHPTLKDNNVITIDWENIS